MLFNQLKLGNVDEQTIKTRISNADKLTEENLIYESEKLKNDLVEQFTFSISKSARDGIGVIFDAITKSKGEVQKVFENDAASSSGFAFSTR